MRITKELEARINRSFEAKYEERFEALSDEARALRESIKEQVTKEVLKVANENPVLASYLANQFYNDFCEAIVSSNVFNRNQSTYDLPQSLTLDKIDAQIKELRTQKKREIENFLIEVAYTKDLSSIKDIFSNFGLDF